MQFRAVNMCNITARFHPDLYETDPAGKISISITVYGIAPLSAVGILLNVLVVWVWGAETTFNCLTFFFRALGFFDCIFIITFNAWYLATPEVVALRFLCFGFRFLVVNTTTLISVCRFAMLFFPLEAQKLSTPFHAKLILCVSAIVITVMKAVDDILHEVEGHGFWLIYHIGTLMVGLCLPLFIQLALTGAMVWKVNKNLKVISPVSSVGRVSIGSLQQEHIRRRLSQQQQYRRKSSFAPSKEKRLSETWKTLNESPGVKMLKTKRMTTTVICITLLAFLAYPVFVTASVYYMLTPEREHRLQEKSIVLATGSLLQILNSSINFVVYYCFLAKFRVLWHKRVERLCRWRPCSRAFWRNSLPAAAHPPPALPPPPPPPPPPSLVTEPSPDELSAMLSNPRARTFRSHRSSRPSLHEHGYRHRKRSRRHREDRSWTKQSEVRSASGAEEGGGGGGGEESREGERGGGGGSERATDTLTAAARRMSVKAAFDLASQQQASPAHETLSPTFQATFGIETGTPTVGETGTVTNTPPTARAYGTPGKGTRADTTPGAVSTAEEAATVSSSQHTTEGRGSKDVKPETDC